MDSAVLWMLLVFFTGPIGLVIYIFARPQGNLVRCASCGNTVCRPPSNVLTAATPEIARNLSDGAGAPGWRLCCRFVPRAALSSDRSRVRLYCARLPTAAAARSQEVHRLPLCADLFRIF